jgi:integrase
MAKRLTDIAVRNLKSSATRYEVPDGAARGLYVVCQPSGRKGFAVRYRFGGKPRKLTLPGNVTLAAARKLAAEAMHEIEQGRDPGIAKQEAAEKAAEAAKDTLQAVCEEFYRRDGAKLRTRDAQLATLKRHVFGPLGGRPIAGIKRKEIVRLLDAVADNGGPRVADLVLAFLSRIMNWHAIRDGEFASPIVRGMARLKPSERARSRVLSDDELRAVVTTARELRTPFAALVLFLLYTAARRREGSHLEWAEIQNNGDWLLPSARNKVKASLLRPLSGAAKHVLGAQVTKQIVGCKFVFSPDGARPLTGYSGHKRRFDATCGVCGWTLHDLRRTARSLMARAGVPDSHAERCLGHAVGSSVARIYDRHDYRIETQQAFEALAALVERIVEGPRGANVVPIHR